MKLMNEEDIPVTLASEQKIAEDALAAIAYLQRTDNLDLVEDLGLAPHI